MATSNVRWFDSTMQGANQLTSAYGSTIAIFKQCLQTGFNTKDITSIVVADGVASVTLASGHGFIDQSWVRISGAAEPVLNDDFQIYEVSTTGFKFTLNGAGSFSGSGAMQAKYATPGNYWETVEEDASAYKILLRSNHPQNTGCALYLEDNKEFGSTTATTKRSGCYIEGIRAFTDINTRTEKYGENYIYKIDCWSGTAGNAPWLMFVDERMIVFVTYPLVVSYPTYTTYSGSIHVFGDIESFQPNDQYSSLVIGTSIPFSTSPDAASYYFSTTSGNTNIVAVGFSSFMNLNESHGKYICRNVSGVIKNERSAMFGSGFTAYSGYSYGTNNPTITSPNLAGGLILWNDIFVRDSTCIRGKFPGIKQSLHNIKLQDREKFFDTQQSRQMIAVNINSGGNGTGQWTSSLNIAVGYSGQVFIDITGPWR